MDMPFDERIYAEMVSLFDDKMPGDVLLVQMDAVWEARFRQDHADFTFQSTSWEALFPEAWYGRFALIVLAPGIEELHEPESVLCALQDFLVEGGSVIVPFRNARHWSVFRSWLAGELRYGSNPLLAGNGRLLSFVEIQRLVKLAHYEELAVCSVVEEGDAETLRLLQVCGAANERRDLETLWWVTRWSAFSWKVLRLKAHYTDAERRLLARLLHRLENGIEAAETVEALRRLLAESRIDGGYLEEFVRNTAGDADSVCDILRKEELLR